MMFEVGDKVISKTARDGTWVLGEDSGYGDKPGEIVQVMKADTYGVRWPDGYLTIEAGGDLEKAP